MNAPPISPGAPQPSNVVRADVGIQERLEGSERAVNFLSAFALLTFGGGLLLLSAFLIAEHGSSLAVVRDQGLPVAAETAALERRRSLLQEQVEAVQAQASLLDGAGEEALHRFVLPREEDVGRAVTALAGAFDTWEQQGDAKDLSPIAAGESERFVLSKTPLVRRPLSFSLSLKDEGRKDFFRFLDLAGLLIVEDMLTSEEREELLLLSEDGDPARAAALRTFLATDLLSYLRQPGAADEQLLQSFPSDALVAFLRRFQASASFREGAALARGGIGHFLRKEKLWPMPFLSLESVREEEGEDGWMKLDVVLDAFGRE